MQSCSARLLDKDQLQNLDPAPISSVFRFGVLVLLGLQYVVYLSYKRRGEILYYISFHLGCEETSHPCFAEKQGFFELLLFCLSRIVKNIHNCNRFLYICNTSYMCKSEDTS